MAPASSEPRITLHPHDRRVSVVIDGTLLADTTRAIELRERGYPPRQYIPRDDVRMDLLNPSETVTHCPIADISTLGDVSSSTTSPTHSPASLPWSPLHPTYRGRFPPR
ncbi:DUF427 domain-containing protein [Halomonas sp. NO4]|uniref:DUF427 domain-containing protein n=1 Tax=Halomonas sp. NO4 TaxID=2484813 RepID=UPI0013D6D6FF|nr:DUF427 domain-containing protein [Halomonas sp. NO4]